MGVIRRSNLRSGDHEAVGYGFASIPPYELKSASKSSKLAAGKYLLNGRYGFRVAGRSAIELRRSARF
jgi:hypothetical protein